MKRHWESILSDTIDRVQPITELPVVNKDSPVIVNIVSTVRIIAETPDKKYRLPLQSLSMFFGPASQYAPVQFAANIVKLKTSTTNSTALIFGSGNIVFVSTLTNYHTRFTSQLFRVIIEQVKCAMKSAEDGVVYVGSLLGRTVFQHNVTHNIVGHAYLGVRVDLQALHNANPSGCKWLPDVFPALKCSIWLVEDQKCICKKARVTDDAEVVALISKAIKRKCACTIKCLIFDSGRIVITGGRQIADVTSVFYRVKQLVPQFRSDMQAVPREDRFYQRLGIMMVVTGNTTKTVKTRPKGELTQSEAIAMALLETRDFKVKKTKTHASVTKLCALMRLAEAGRVDAAQACVQMDATQLLLVDDKGNTAAQRLQAMERTPNQEKILQMILTAQREHDEQVD